MWWGRVLNEKIIEEGKSWMSVELRERKWCGVLRIEKVDVECCWMVLTIVNGLRSEMLHAFAGYWHPTWHFQASVAI